LSTSDGASRPLLPLHQKILDKIDVDQSTSTPPASADELSQVREFLTGQLQQLLTDSGLEGEIVIDRYNLGNLLNCAATSQSSREDFSWSALFASRSLGIAAIEQQLTARHASLRAALDSVIAAEVRSQTSLGDWIANLTKAQTSAVVARASSWSNRVWLSFPWQHFERIDIHRRPVWHRPLGYGSQVITKARPDLSIHVPHHETRERVVVTFGWPDAQISRLDALVLALDTERPPSRIVSIYPPSGDVVALDFTGTALRTASSELVAAARAAASDTPAESPGTHCWTCGRRSDCMVGVAWTSAQVRRRAGIPDLDR